MSGKSNQIIGRVLATLFFATVVGFWVYVTSVPTLRDATTTLTALGGVHTVQEEDGDVWFWRPFRAFLERSGILGAVRGVPGQDPWNIRNAHPLELARHGTRG